MLAKLSYKITFVMCGPSKNSKDNVEEKDVSALINKEKLSSDAKEEYLSVGDFTAPFAPKIRLGDLYSKRLPSGHTPNDFCTLFTFLFSILIGCDLIVILQRIRRKSLFILFI